LENEIVTSIKLANREVWQLAQEKADHHGMGTTIVAIRTNENTAAVAHVGDSRAYLVRNGKIIQKTRDHSWVNEQLARGIITAEEAKTHRWKNVITRALGNKADIEVDVSTTEMEPNDIFLLCSDGLCAGDGVEEETILEKILANEADLATASRILIGLANDIGGKDNITVVLLKNFATEEEAEEASRDTSSEDTNPIALNSIPPPGLEVDKTAEMGEDFKGAVMDAAAKAANQVDGDLFEDEEDDMDATNPMAQPVGDEFSAPTKPLEAMEDDDTPVSENAITEDLDVPGEDLEQKGLAATDSPLSTDDLSTVFEEDETKDA
jgi:serine/threonine protein phosphatase PrpC